MAHLLSAEAFNDPALPQWTLTVEPMLHEVRDHLEQLGVIAGFGQRDAV